MEFVDLPEPVGDPVPTHENLVRLSERFRDRPANLPFVVDDEHAEARGIFSSFAEDRAFSSLAPPPGPPSTFGNPRGNDRRDLELQKPLQPLNC